MRSIDRSAIVLAVAAAVAMLVIAPGNKPVVLESTVLGAPTVKPTISHVPLPAARPSRAIDPPVSKRPLAPPLPFSFHGRITEAGETSIVLHGAGRVLAVRGPGPLAEDYDVETIEVDYMVLRYLPLDEQQVLPLETRSYAIAPPASPDESPQD